MKKWLLMWALAGQAMAIPTPPAIGLPPPLPSLPGGSLPAPPAVPAQDSQAVQTLSYESAPLLALANNPKVTASLATVREALAKTEVTAAPARPQALLGLQGPPIPVSETGNFRSDYVLSPIRVEFRQLIYDGGRIMAAIDQGKSVARQQAVQAQVDWQDLYFQVRKSYLTTLTRQGDIAVAQQQVQLTKQQLRQAQVRYEVGKAPRGDVLSAELPVSQAELMVQRKQAAYAKSQQELNQLLGLAMTTPLQLEAPKLPVDQLPDLDKCLSEALSQRPALIALDYQLQASLKAIEAGELDNSPYVSVLLGAAGVSQGTQILTGPQYRGGFEVNWQFADGGKATHLADAARAVRDRNLALIQEKRRMVELEVRDAYRDLQVAVETHTSEQLRVKQSKDSLRISQAQYRAGMINTYAVRQAQNDYYETQLAEVQAYYDYFLSLAKLDLACGRSGGTKVDAPWPED